MIWPEVKDPRILDLRMDSGLTVTLLIEILTRVLSRQLEDNDPRYEDLKTSFTYLSACAPNPLTFVP